VLRSGIPQEMLPQEMGCGSGMTCWRRLRDWQAAGASVYRNIGLSIWWMLKKRSIGLAGISPPPGRGSESYASGGSKLG
jgi:transposase